VWRAVLGNSILYQFRSNLFAAEFIGEEDKDGVDGEEMLKYQERESREYGNKGESVANIIFGDI